MDDQHTYGFKPTQKTVTDGDGRRVTVRLSPKTRNDIAWLCTDACMTERAWLEHHLAAMPDDCKNVTGWVRDFASQMVMDRLVGELETPAIGYGSPAVGLSLAGLHDDDDFARVVKQGVVEATVDIGNVKVRAGMNEFGCVCFYLESQLKGDVHLIISTPFKPTEWLERVEG